jgi:hypothetical protein
MTATEATGTSVATEQRPQWSLATLIAFRFGTCYFGSFGLELLIGLIPVILAGIGIDGPWSAMRGLIHEMRPPIEWIGSHLLGLHVETTQVGSDSAFQWTALFCIAVLSAWATMIWTLLDLRRRRYDRLQTWVWTVLQLMLAASMFYFGMAKVIPTQMPFVLNRLVEPYGNFSPTGALWAQVGISPAYQSCSARRKCLAAYYFWSPERPRPEHWCARSIWRRSSSST